MAPPCQSFSVALGDKLRNRDRPEGRGDLDAEAKAAVDKHNKYVDFVVQVALAAKVRGVPFTIENPADRGDVESDAYWPKYANHGPMWLMPAMQLLSDVVQPFSVTFPQCALGAAVQKYTTLWTTSPQVRDAFSELACTHDVREGQWGVQV